MRSLSGASGEAVHPHGPTLHGEDGSEAVPRWGLSAGTRTALPFKGETAEPSSDPRCVGRSMSNTVAGQVKET
jgi:hypothetical protein